MKIKIEKNRGFVILFAVILSSMLLAVTMGIANIALKEIKFGTSAKDTNNSFFAADTGIECALINDKGDTSVFPLPGPATQQITCASSVPNNITVSFAGNASTGTYTFVVTGLGSSTTSCARVTVFKDGASSPPYVKTNVTSKGYNIGNAACDSSNPDRIEREIQTNY